MKRLFFSIIASALISCPVSAQNQFLKHLDLSLTAGSTGIGFDVAAPVNDMVQIRTGAAFIPQFHKKMNFGVEVGDVSKEAYKKYLELNPDYTKTYKEWRAEISTGRFAKLAGMLEDFTGLQVNNSVDMIGVPNMNTFKMMVDVFPFEDKHWHFTAGFYVGGTKVAKAYNTTEDMTTLLAVTIYNDMYKRVLGEKPLMTYNGTSVYLPSAFTSKIREYGMMSLPIGEFSHDIIATEDVLWDYDETDEETGDWIHRAGDVRFKQGEVMYKEGDLYYMVPDKDNMVKAKAKVNAVRPYLGFGYGGFIDKQQRTQISFDCGVMFWGGVPKIVTHDGIDMVHDLTNVRGSVNDYIKLINKFPAYPVLNLRITQRLF